MGLDEQFQEYFAALDRSRGEDRCFVSRGGKKRVALKAGSCGVPAELGLSDDEISACTSP